MHARILEGDLLRTTEKLDDIRAAIQAKQPTWVDLENQSDDANALLRELDIHPLTIEDIWASRSMPKLEDYENYLYIIVHGVKSAKERDFELIELDIVIGPPRPPPSGQGRAAAHRCCAGSCGSSACGWSCAA